MVRYAFGATWTADFLTVPPTAPDLVLDEELRYLESLDDDRIRADLEFVAGPLPAVFTATGLARTAADLLRWVWDAHHPRRVGPAAEGPPRGRRLPDRAAQQRRVVRGPGRHRARRALAGQRPAAGQRAPVPAARHPRHDLMLIAAHSRGSWVSWRLPDTFARRLPRHRGVRRRPTAAARAPRPARGSQPRADPQPTRLADEHQCARRRDGPAARERRRAPARAARRRPARAAPIRTRGPLLAEPGRGVPGGLSRPG